MSKNRMINTKFWSDGWIINLEPLERYLFLYLLTNEHTNICGIYELPLKIIERESGIDQKTILNIFKKLSNKIVYHNDWIYIKNFLKHQKSSGNVKAGIEAGLKEVPNEIMASIKQSLDTPPCVPPHTPNTAYNLNSNLNFNLNPNLNMKERHEVLPENNLKKLQETSAYKQEFYYSLSPAERVEIEAWIKDFTDIEVMRAFEIKFGVRGWFMAKIERYGMDKFRRAYKAGENLKQGSLYDRAKIFGNILYS